MPALNACYDLRTEDPLTVAGLIQPADINLLVARGDGKYVLSAMMLGIGGKLSDIKGVPLTTADPCMPRRSAYKRQA